MEKQLIGRGLLAGAVAGLIAFVVARIFAEPLIQQAIDYESARDAAQDALDRAAGVAVPPSAPELFSRTVQADVGIGVGLILFGAAMGALVAVAYAICLGRTGGVRPFPLALLVAAFGFVGVFAVPFAKYPANPPAIGHEETIRTRGALYLITVFVSCLALFLAVYLGQRLHRRFGLYASVLTAAAGYLVVMGVLFAVLPPFGHLSANVAEYGRQSTETPLPLTDDSGALVFPGFPADLLAQFRLYAVLDQLILWGVIALVFAPLATRLLRGTHATPVDAARSASPPAPVTGG